MSSTRFPLAQVSQSLAARFEAQDARHSARVAVQGDGRNLTYDELNGIAAAALDRLGGVPGPVAVLAEHGTLAPAAVLGVLKAGCFCVPLDPGDPERRSAFILADSEARLFLADRLHLEAARALAARTARPVAVYAIEEARPRATANLSVKASPDDLCLVMYTSGSTDTPKGVCQRHRNILHNAMIYTDTAGLGVEDRLSLLHRTGTAAGATALFEALLNGAAILPFDVRRQGLDRLTAWLESEEITVLHAVPTLFRRLTQRLEDGRRLEDIRLIRLGGEAVTLTEWRLFRDHFSEQCALLAGLGSSESLSLRQALFTQDLDPGCPVLPVGDAVADKEISLVGPGGAGKPPATRGAAAPSRTPVRGPGDRSVKRTTTIDSPLGELVLVSDGAALTALKFRDGPGDGTTPAGNEAAPLPQARRELQEYFAGRRTVFEIPLGPAGTPFQKRVWEALRRIPYGTTTTYRDIAIAIGSPRAARAVGAANSLNPLAIVVPCHRVIGSDGRLSGYAGGPARKRALLEREAVLDFSPPGTTHCQVSGLAPGPRRGRGRNGARGLRLDRPGGGDPRGA